MKIFISK